MDPVATGRRSSREATVRYRSSRPFAPPFPPFFSRPSPLRDERSRGAPRERRLSLPPARGLCRRDFAVWSCYTAGAKSVRMGARRGVRACVRACVHVSRVRDIADNARARARAVLAIDESRKFRVRAAIRISREVFVSSNVSNARYRAISSSIYRDSGGATLGGEFLLSSTDSASRCAVTLRLLRSAKRRLLILECARHPRFFSRAPRFSLSLSLSLFLCLSVCPSLCRCSRPFRPSPSRTASCTRESC